MPCALSPSRHMVHLEIKLKAICLSPSQGQASRWVGVLEMALIQPYQGPRLCQLPCIKLPSIATFLESSQVSHGKPHIRPFTGHYIEDVIEEGSLHFLASIRGHLCSPRVRRRELPQCGGKAFALDLSKLGFGPWLCITLVV